jgi:Histidine phosphatase superfamily (branch 1)
MRIGLVRHFPVTEAWPSGWLTSDDLQRWRARYELSEPVPGPMDVSHIAWQRCFSSDLKRAYATAQAAYVGTIIQTPLLREAEMRPFATGRLRLPVWSWRWIFRLAWLTGHKSQRPARDDLVRRVREMADLLEAETVDTLVVSHAGIMVFLRKELLRRGFRGPGFRLAEHGRLYVLERPKSSVNSGKNQQGDYYQKNHPKNQHG